VADPDWSTEAGLAALKQELAGRIPGWQSPIAYAVGSAGPVGWEFPHVNAPGGRHGLPAVVLAGLLGHDGSTATIELSLAQLTAAIAALAPAEACRTVDHPNLRAWRAVRAALDADPARRAAVVFIADLGDPVGSEADRCLRQLLA
jgi:hypothetical protein